LVCEKLKEENLSDRVLP